MVAAQGEMDASKSLREAAETIAQSSSALQLRYAAYLMKIWLYQIGKHGIVHKNFL